MSALDTMRAATPLVRRATLCLDGILQDEYDALMAELPEASAREQSLAQTEVTRIATRMNEIHEQMKAAEVVFSFGGLPWFRRLALEGEHPPRDGNLIDKMSGHNVATYTAALIREACRSVKGADGEVFTEIPADYWEPLLGKPADGDQPEVGGLLNYKQVSDLYNAAAAANDNATTVPPSARSLLASQDSGASSKPPGPGTSRRAASKGGSRSGSPSTSGTRKAG